MKLNLATLDSLYTGFNTKLQEGIAAAAADAAHEKFSMTMPSSTKMETYAWLLMLSSMRKWVGPRIVNQLDKQAAQLVNDDYEHTIGVSRNDIEDDNLAIYAPLFVKMGQDAARLWPRLAVAALVTNDVWIDGKNFYCADRKYGESTINNLLAKALSFESFVEAKTLMGGYCAHNAEPMEIIPTHLVVGPALEDVALNILKNDYRLVEGAKGAAAIKNVQAGICEVVVTRRLAGANANKWFLVSAADAVKPVVVQKRKEGALQRWDTDKDPCVKDHNRCDYGIHYRGAAAKTLPNLVIGGNL